MKNYLRIGSLLTLLLLQLTVSAQQRVRCFRKNTKLTSGRNNPSWTSNCDKPEPKRNNGPRRILIGETNPAA